MSWPSVHISILHLSRDKTKLQTCHSSLSYPGVLTFNVLHTDKKKPGGLFAQVMEDWLRSDAEYVGYICSGSTMIPERLSEQALYMKTEHLSGCYGDMGEVDRAGNLLAVEEFRDFSTEMIGVDCIDPQTLLVDKNKFKNSGGFDNLLAGSCYPNAYLVTMCAVGGKVARLKKILTHRVLGERKWGPEGMDLLAWARAEDEFWKRFQFDKYVSQAKEHYKSMGW